MEQNKFYINSFGVKISKCCASCIHKKMDNSLRICLKGEGHIPGDYICKDWGLNPAFEKAGKGDGAVKKAHYLQYCLSRMTEEDTRFQQAVKEGHLYKRATPTEIRSEYNKSFGSIYELKKTLL